MKKFFAVIVVIGSFLGLFTGCTLLEEPVVVEMSSWDMALDPGDMFGVAFMTMNVTVPGQLESLTFFDSTQGGSPEDFEEIRFYYQYELVASVQPTTTTFEVTFGENGLRLEPLVTELYVECTISQTATRGAKHQLSLQSLSGKADVESEMEGITIPYILANPGATTGWLTIGREIVPEGQLIINRSPVMPTSRQVYSGLEFEVMNYYLTAQNEDIRVTELPIFIDTAHYDSIERFWCYVDGQIVGNPDGQMPHPYGTYWLPCDFVVNDFLSSYLVLVFKVANRHSVVSGKQLRVGLGDSNGDNSQWETVGNYAVTATGISSGTVLPQWNINSTGQIGGLVYGGGTFYLYKGVLMISLNPSSPSGLRVPSTQMEVLRFDLTAVGDNIVVDDLEFEVIGTASGITGTSAAYLKKVINGSVSSVTYATWPAGTSWLDPDRNGTFSTYFSVSGDDSDGMFDNLLEIPSGETVTVALLGDTTGGAVNRTLQVSVKGYADTASGIKWRDSGLPEESQSVDSSLTGQVPVTGGAIYF